MCLPLLSIEIFRRVVEDGIGYGDLIYLALEHEEEALLDVVRTPASEAEHDSGANIDGKLGLFATSIVAVANVECLPVAEDNANVA